MNSLTRRIMGIALLLCSGFAGAATYTFTTDPYTTYVPPSGNAFDPGTFTSGSIVTSAPVPPNLNFGDITSLITSYSFSDGLHSYTPANSVIHPTFGIGGGFKVNTDAQGNITDAFVLIMATVPSNAVDSPVNYFAFGDGYHAYHNMNCLALADGLCNQVEFVIDVSSRVVSNNLTVTSDQVNVGSPSAIPAIPQWGLISLIGLMIVVGFGVIRQVTNRS